MKENFDFWTILPVLIVLLCSIIGFEIKSEQLYTVHREAVNRGYAHYDNQTGVWEWNTNAETNLVKKP